jgi:hypothetical protein
MAFINPSGPTREPQQILVLASDKFSFLPLSVGWNHPTTVDAIGCARHSVLAERFQACNREASL